MSSSSFLPRLVAQVLSEHRTLSEGMKRLGCDPRLVLLLVINYHYKFVLLLFPFPLFCRNYWHFHL